MKLSVIFSLLITVVLLSGCSVAMSANRSAYKGDPAMMSVGADRSLIESTFGPPFMKAELEGDRTKVIYKIDPTAHKPVARNAAVAGHAAADVLTLGLWEVVGTPIEIAAHDNFTNYIIVYGPDNKIQSVEVAK